MYLLKYLIVTVVFTNPKKIVFKKFIAVKFNIKEFFFNFLKKLRKFKGKKLKNRA